MTTNFKKKIVSPILQHTWLQQSYQIYKIEEGKLENCSRPEFHFNGHFTSRETDEERPMLYRQTSYEQAFPLKYRVHRRLLTG